MKRKNIAGLIAIAAIAAMAMFSGCIEEEATTSTDIYASDEIVISTMKSVLADNGIQGVDIEVVDTRNKGGVKSLILSYESTAVTGDDMAGEIGTILGTYLGAKEGGWNVDELNVVVGDRKGAAVGMWSCSKKWTDDYINGKLSDTELLSNVFSSIRIL